MDPTRRLPVALAALTGLLADAGAAQVTRAQEADVRPRAWSLAGEVSGTLSPEDRGFFNDTSYEHNALRLLRMSLSAAVRPHDRVSLLTELRSENGDEPRVYALYVRAQPRARFPLHLQAGLVPPVFGAYPRQRYSTSSPFLATPIAYQYLTTLRTDAAPASADDLLRVRGRGWLLGLPLGARDEAPGLPVADGQRYDTGAQVRWGNGIVDAAVSVTRGSLSRPRTRDDNRGAAVASRVSWRPLPALTLGASQSRGAWLGRDLMKTLRPYGTVSAVQTAWGTDAEIAAGHWLARGEVLWSAWSGLPVGPGGGPATVRALGATGEARYRAAPGLTVGVRAERLAFSRISGSAGQEPWEAPVTRMEIAASFAPARHLVLKAGYQRNWRDAGRVRRSGLLAAQVAAWF